MGVQIASNIEPKNGQTYYLVEDIYLKGGLSIRNNTNERDAIDPANLKEGQLILCLDSGLIYQATNLTQITPSTPNVTPGVTWIEFSGFGGGSTGLSDAPSDGHIYGRQDGTWTEVESAVSKRSVVIHTIDNLTVGGRQEFNLGIGPSCLVLKLEVSRPVKVLQYSSAGMNDSNPYEFQATSDHLIDDGSMLLNDGTIFRTRNFSIFSNMENPVTDVIYFSIESIDEVEGPVALTITYLVTETL